MSIRCMVVVNDVLIQSFGCKISTKNV